jgi:hypothetical protein
VILERIHIPQNLIEALKGDFLDKKITLLLHFHLLRTQSRSLCLRSLSPNTSKEKTKMKMFTLEFSVI